MSGSLPNLTALVHGVCPGQRCLSEERCRSPAVGSAPVPPSRHPMRPRGSCSMAGLGACTANRASAPAASIVSMARDFKHRSGSWGVELVHLREREIPPWGLYWKRLDSGEGDGSASGAVHFQMRRRRWCPRANRSPSGNNPQNHFVPSESALERSCPISTWIKCLAQHQTNWANGHFSFDFRAVGWFLHDLPSRPQDPSAWSGTAVSWTEGDVLSVNRKGFDWNSETAEHFKTSCAHSLAHTRTQAEPTCSPKVRDPPLGLSWSRCSSWHRSDLLLPGEESTRCSGRRGQVSSCLDVLKKCLSILVEKWLREPSKLGNRKYCTSINLILTAEMRGK